MNNIFDNLDFSTLDLNESVNTSNKSAREKYNYEKMFKDNYLNFKEFTKIESLEVLQGMKKSNGTILKTFRNRKLQKTKNLLIETLLNSKHLTAKEKYVILHKLYVFSQYTFETSFFNFLLSENEYFKKLEKEVNDFLDIQNKPKKEAEKSNLKK